MLVRHANMLGRKFKFFHRSKIDLKLRLQWAQDWSQHLDAFLSKLFIYCVTSSHHLPIRYQISAVLNAITIITPHLCCQDPFGCLTCSALVCYQDCWCGDTTGSPQGLLWRDQDRLKPKELTSKFHEMIPRARLLSMSLDLRLRAAFGRMRSEQ